MKKILIVILAAILIFLASPVARAAPVSWDGNVGTAILQPLQAFWGSVIKANNFTATSTTAINTFPNLSSTNATTTNLSIGSLTGFLKGTSGTVSAVSSLVPGDISLTKGNFLVGNDAGVAQATSSIFVSSTGNLGIGTTSPGQELDVNGDIQTNGNLYFSRGATNGSTNGVVWIAGSRFMHNFNYGNNGVVTTSGRNTFVGEASGNFTMGSTATGVSEASYNVGLGHATLVANTIGYYNVAVGASAMAANTTGATNVAVGGAALGSNTTGTANTALGYTALYNNTTGNSNTGLGYLAGRYIADGGSNATSSNSTYVGHNTRASFSGAVNETVIGYNAIGAGTNSTVIGGSTNTKTILTGNVGIGTTDPAGLLQVALGNGQLAHFGTNFGVEVTKYAGIGLGYAEAGPTYQKSAIVQEQIGDSHARGTIHILNSAAVGATNAALSDARLSITYEGNVGIGTTTPGTILSIGSSTQYINLSNTATSTFAFGIQAPSINLSGFLQAVSGIFSSILTIPYNAALSLASNGDIGIDSTSNQFQYRSGGATRVLGDGNFYPAFTYATSTAWTGTTTIPLGPAYTGETWNGVKCFTDTGTLNVSFYDGTNRMNMFNASTTVGTVGLVTNNTFTADEKRYVDIGTPASTPTKISCTVSKSVTAN